MKGDIRNIFGFFIVSMTMIVCYGLGGCAHRIPPLSSQEDVSQPHPKALQHYRQGVLYDIEKDYYRALVEYYQALDYDSTSSSIYLAIAKDYRALKKNESATMAAQKAVRANSEDLEARRLLSSMYKLNGETEKAREQLEKIVQLDSTDVTSWYELGTLYSEDGDFQQALWAFQGALKAKPGYPKAHYG